MSDSTGTAAGPGAGDDPDVDSGLSASAPDDGHDDDLEASDAVPAGALGTATLAPARQRRGLGRIRNIGTFYRQVVAELRKVIWPTRKELLTYTTVVVVFVLIMVAIVSAFDFVFSQGVLAVFGDGSS